MKRQNEAFLLRNDRRMVVRNSVEYIRVYKPKNIGKTILVFDFKKEETAQVLPNDSFENSFNTPDRITSTVTTS